MVEMNTWRGINLYSMYSSSLSYGLFASAASTRFFSPMLGLAIGFGAGDTFVRFPDKCSGFGGIFGFAFAVTAFALAGVLVLDAVDDLPSLVLTLFAFDWSSFSRFGASLLTASLLAMVGLVLSGNSFLASAPTAGAFLTRSAKVGGPFRVLCAVSARRRL